jgi:3-oxoacyl-[acyl-carrier protein] reductase
VEAALGRFGGLDILVNSVGYAKLEAFLDFSYSNFKDMMAMHVDGTFLACQHAARAMARLGGGRIVTMSSVAAAQGQFGFGAYGTAKAAIEGLTRVLAVELAQYKIRVNCLSPGPVLTEMLKGVYTAEQLTERARTIPAQRLASAQEVADTALFLVSPESAYMTGQVLRLDGGATGALRVSPSPRVPAVLPSGSAARSGSSDRVRAPGRSPSALRYSDAGASERSLGR